MTCVKTEPQKRIQNSIVYVWLYATIASIKIDILVYIIGSSTMC